MSDRRGMMCVGAQTSAGLGVLRSICSEGLWWIPFFMASAVTALVCAPGLYCYDSIDQLRQAREGVYQDWHPPMMAWFWRQCLHIWGAPSGLAWAHLVLFLLGGFLVCWRMKQWSPALAVCTAWLLCMPEVQNFAFVIWKDTAMAVAMLAAIGIQLNLPKSRFAKGAGIAAYFLILAYAVGVRVNALPAVVPLAAHLMWSTLGVGKRWRLIAAIGFGLACASVLGLINTFMCYGGLGATRGAPQQTLQLFDLAGVALRSGVDVIPEECKTDAYTPERLAAAYDVSCCMKLLLPMADGSPAPLRSVSWSANMSWDEGVERLGSAWREAITGQPLAYLQHRVAVCSSLLRLGEDCAYYAVVTPEDSARLTGHPGLGAGASVEGCEWVKWAWLSLMSWAAGQSILMFGYPWIIVLVVSIGIAFWRRRHAHASVLMTLAFSGLLYALPYGIAAPAADFRYLYWSVIAAHLALPLAVWLAIKGSMEIEGRDSV